MAEPGTREEESEERATEAVAARVVADAAGVAVEEAAGAVVAETAEAEVAADRNPEARSSFRTGREWKELGTVEPRARN